MRVTLDLLIGIIFLLVTFELFGNILQLIPNIKSFWTTELFTPTTQQYSTSCFELLYSWTVSVKFSILSFWFFVWMLHLEFSCWSNLLVESRWVLWSCLVACSWLRKISLRSCRRSLIFCFSCSDSLIKLAFNWWHFSQSFYTTDEPHLQRNSKLNGLTFNALIEVEVSVSFSVRSKDCIYPSQLPPRNYLITFG